jgi:enoyl-CoA hydratase/carnithine racemase
MPSDSNTAPILFSERPTTDGHALGIVTLNVPQALNALSLEMIDQLTARLAEWETDSRIVAVWLEGAGERAFCAGGDIVKLYQSMVAHPQEPNLYQSPTPSQANPYAEAFFSREYRLDYFIHRYSKPILCWGSGIVMGGGMGLMAGASHRIVTETSRLAMPEISIGLFPDVGGTWFLNRMPPGCGLYLGLTGSAINATDALFLNLADYFVPSSQKEALLEKLSQLNWSDSDASNRTMLSEQLRIFSDSDQTALPPPQVEAHLPQIQAATQHEQKLSDVVNAILTQPADDAWIAKGIRNLQKGCMVTAHLVWEQLHRGKNLSLGQVFRQELTMAVQCTRHPDFREGVRALLIDKDNRPQWQFTRVEDVPASIVEAHFRSPWAPHEHPLLDL